MMDTVYFKKELPATPFMLSNGRKIKFDTLDNQTGYLAISNPQTIFDLRTAQSQQIGGVTEIALHEYDAFVKKKQHGSTPLPQAWREELRPATLPMQTAGVAEPALEQNVELPIQPPPQPAPQARPTASRRKPLA